MGSHQGLLSVLAVGCSCVLPPSDGIPQCSQCHCQSSESQTAPPQLLSWVLASLAQVLAKPCFPRLSCLACPSATLGAVSMGSGSSGTCATLPDTLGLPGSAGTDSRRSCRALRAHASIHTSASKEAPQDCCASSLAHSMFTQTGLQKCSKQHLSFTGHCS